MLVSGRYRTGYTPVRAMPYLSKYTAAFVPVLMATASLIWAVVYVRSVQDNPAHDAAATALIGPLVWILVPLGILTALQAVWAASKGLLDEQHGLNDRKRLTYLAALTALLFALPWLGFLGAGLPFFAALSFSLGFKRITVLAALTAGLAVVIWLGFAELLNISLPLYPGQRG